MMLNVMEKFKAGRALGSTEKGYCQIQWIHMEYGSLHYEGDREDLTAGNQPGIKRKWIDRH